MTREEWITRCTATFESAGYHYRPARDFAITEFNIACRDEPIDGSPELPVDRWPVPEDVAAMALNEWAAERDD